MIVKPVNLLLDEHIWEGLAEALRERGHDVIHYLSNCHVVNFSGKPISY